MVGASVTLECLYVEVLTCAAWEALLIVRILSRVLAIDYDSIWVVLDGVGDIVVIVIDGSIWGCHQIVVIVRYIDGGSGFACA